VGRWGGGQDLFGRKGAEPAAHLQPPALPDRAPPVTAPSTVSQHKPHADIESPEEDRDSLLEQLQYIEALQGDASSSPAPQQPPAPDEKEELDLDDVALAALDAAEAGSSLPPRPSHVPTPAASRCAARTPALALASPTASEFATFPREGKVRPSLRRSGSSSTSSPASTPPAPGLEQLLALALKHVPTEHCEALWCVWVCSLGCCGHALQDGPISGCWSP
jgi:hypothetical protein